MNNDTIGFLTSENYVPPPKKRLEKGERSASGGVWFVTVLPVIGLFLELFATDKYSGAALWIAVVFMIFYGCVADFRQVRLEFYESDEEKLRRLLICPPAYLYYREKLRTGEGYKGIVLVILTAAALFANGFTQGLQLNEKNIVPKVENAWVSDLDNFSGSSDYLLEERLELWFDEEYQVEGSKTGGSFSVVFSGRHEGKPASVTVSVFHDGFAFQSIKVDDITLDGKSLEGDEFKAKLTEIFIGD